MNPFILTLRAEQDSDIWDYINAERVLAALQKTTRRLAKNPGIGHMHKELADRRRHRFFPVYSYLIVYFMGLKPNPCR